MKKSKSKTTRADPSEFPGFVSSKANRYTLMTMKRLCGEVALRKPPSCGLVLVIGNPASGKTALLGNLKSCLESVKGGPKVRKFTTDEFICEFINGIRLNTLQAFKNRVIEKTSVLLIDDFDRFDSKIRSQEELLLIMESLLARGKAIVLTMTSDPRKLSEEGNFSDRVLRFLSRGLVLPLDSPDKETLFKILQIKCRNGGVVLPPAWLRSLVPSTRLNSNSCEGLAHCLLATQSYLGTLGLGLDLSRAVVSKKLIPKVERT